MGKANKKKRSHGLRFNPMERADSMQTESSRKPEQPQLSSHQQRHLERKRLQAEAQDLKRQRGKVSKAMGKFQHKAEKKALTKSLHAVKAAAAALRSEPLAAAAPAAASFAFDLPVPASTASSSAPHATWPSAQPAFGSMPAMKG